MTSRSQSVITLRVLLFLSFFLLGACRSSSPAASDALYASDVNPFDIEDVSHAFQGVTSWYRIWQKSGPPAKKPMIVFFHGNLGSNFGPPRLAPERILSPSALEGQGGNGQLFPTLDQIRFEAQTDQIDFWDQFVLLAILAPTDSDRPYKSGKTLTWGSLASQNSLLPEAVLDFHADFAFDVIARVMRENPSIDERQIYLVGQSGGSLFLGNTMLPKYGPRFGGGAIFLCGGEKPRLAFLKDLTPEFASKFNLYFHSTEKESDHLKPLIDEAFDVYSDLWKDAPVPAVKEVIGPGKHCMFHTNSQPKIIEMVIKEWWKRRGSP